MIFIIRHVAKHQSTSTAPSSPPNKISGSRGGAASSNSTGFGKLLPAAALTDEYVTDEIMSSFVGEYHMCIISA